MASGRAARDDQKVRVAPVFGDMLADPPNGELQIDERIGKAGLGEEAIIGRDAYPSAGGQIREQRQRLLALVAQYPAPAVDLEQHGGAACYGAGAVNVELPAAAGGIRDIDVDLDARIVKY